jgi:hypothetical protein
MEPQRGNQSRTFRERAIGLPDKQLQRWQIASVVVLAVGSIGPWATATIFGVTVSAGGLQGGGWVTLITALFGGLFVETPWAQRVPWIYRRRRGIWRVLLGLSLIVCILNLFQVESYGLDGIVQPGWGLYLAFIASVSAAVAEWAVHVRSKGPLPASGHGPD